MGLIVSQFRRVKAKIDFEIKARKKKIPYLILAPDYVNSSAGVRALHLLAHLLNSNGYEAHVNSKPNPLWNESPLVAPTAAGVCPRAIAVYPEICDSSNPFQCKFQVRWILNKPGYLSGPTQYDPEELLFVWDEGFLNLPKDRWLTVDLIEGDLFNKKNRSIAPKKDVVWIGKGPQRGVKLEEMTKDLTEITKAWPKKREQLAQLLKKTRTLYTYDDRTSLILEALLCGCEVVLLPENKKYNIKDFRKRNHKKELRNFIKVTQNWARGNNA